MGNYNPHTPDVLGQEWVPIRDEDLAFSPAVNSIELGHQFEFTIAVGTSEARFYINELRPLSDRGQTFMAAIYPAGAEEQSGPITRLLIPVNSVAASGGTVSGGAPNAVTALLTPSSSTGISLDCSQPLVGLILNFNVGQYVNLNGKRILGVNLLTGTNASSDITGPTRTNNTSLISVSTDPTFNFIGNPQAIFGRLRTEREIQRTAYGEINQFWTANSPNATADRMPWTFGQLLRLDATATRLYTKIETGTIRGTTSNSSCYIFYAALEILFCEEKRLYVGATQFGTSASTTFGTESVLGANQILLHDFAGGLNPIIPAGHYVVTLSSADVGGLNDRQVQNTSDYPDVNGVRQLYTIPSHPGVKIDIPFPLVDHVGETFTSEVTDILPQITLHSTSAVLTEPHVYGRQGAAQVYGVNTAIQDIFDDISGVSAPYPQVRYYARRFGDTTVPLTLTGLGVFTGSSASITAATFDELPEILDGWKEITLRFTNVPAMGAATGNPAWRWSAFGETAGNRWEVLAAVAPAVSGVGGNYYNLLPASNQLYTATYQPPAGSTVELTWLPQGVASPWVSGASIDQATDAVLIFSQDPATVTGVSLTARTQTVTGYALDCGSLPCCIPSGIGYQQISWSRQGLTGIVRDSYDRTVVNGFGSPDEGGAYTLTEAGTSYQVNGLEGRITPAAANIPAAATIDVGTPDFDVTAELGVVGNLIAGTTGRANLVGRLTDASNQYTALIQQTESTGAAVLGIQKTVAGVETVIIAISSPLAINGGGRIMMRFMGQGSLLKVKAWPLSDPQPDSWDIEITDTSLTTGNRAGVSGRSGTTQGNTLGFNNLLITPPSFWFGGYELQRFDQLSGDFQTIMLSSDITTTSFNDYEARVGLTSVYRIRSLNALNFAGQWSTMVSGAPPTPGITGGCSDMTGALIFTSNADQTGASNAAYIMQWPNTPTEDFTLPEGDMVTYQPMYGRDGGVAFHGTERGLEAFNRTVLLHAAAIDPERLANAATIRNLAWADLPYVCVRDDIGDRWFASVRVPSVNARLNRTRYMARLEIVETTLTPYPVPISP